MGKNKSLFVCVFLFMSTGFSWAQQQTYFVKFKDKASNTYSIAAPEDFLTARALQRRQKCRVVVDEKDLPVSQTYIDQVVAAGAQLLYPLKWMNGVVLRSDASVKAQISSMAFVEHADPSVKFRTAGASGGVQQTSFAASASMSLSDYSFAQNDMLGMPRMNADGYSGEDVLIAITDDGFLRADTMKAFHLLRVNNQIIDTWDLVDLDKTVYAQGGGHGTHVFSILAGYMVNQIYAPGRGANFLLFRTEDTGSESPLEELNWVRAAEIADSMGSDIIQVSLGYNTFDDASLDYTINELDGKTSYSSQGAAIAATRGIVVVVSAGNAGNSSWKKILCPSDAEGVLAVGAVDMNRQRASFSGIGYSADGRVKPDVMAMGVNVTYVSNAISNIAFGSGTSYASPLVTALCAGLMQAYPELTHEELIRTVRYSADRTDQPDAFYGYGIPHYQRASAFASLLLNKEEEVIYPNPFGSHVYAKIRGEGVGHTVSWKLYTLTGALAAEGEKLAENDIVNLFSMGNQLPSGLYCLKLSYNGRFSTFRLIK